MSEKPVRKFGKKTQHDYIRHIENLAKDRSPDTATAQDLRCCQVHQTKTGVQPPSVNSSAVTVALGRANLAAQLTGVHYPRRLPRVSSPEEVARLLEAAPGPCLRNKAALSVAYGASDLGEGWPAGVTPSGHGPAIAGGRGRLPRPWRRVA
jgi:integrase/recombinase XerD